MSRLTEVLLADLVPDSEQEELTPKLKARLRKMSRRVLLQVFRVARKRARSKGAYFWRNLKVETWRLLAGLEA